MNSNDILYGFVFNYNPFTDTWRVTSRDNYTELFSGGENTVSSSNIYTLISIIHRTQGDFTKVNQLLND